SWHFPGAGRKQPLSATVKIVRRKTKQAVPSFKVHPYVKRLCCPPSDILVGNNQRGSIDKFISQHITWRILIIISLLCISTSCRIDIARIPVVLKRAVISCHTIAGSEFKLANK